jgi:hypothetical protein
MLNPVSFFLLAIAAPYVILLSQYVIGKRKQHMRLEASRQADLVAELQETEV